MIVEILDGYGSGKRAKINNANRIETFSITESRIADISIRKGESFIFSSDFVSLTTTASFNGLMYIKNEDPNKILFIDKVRICGTGSSMGSMQAEFTKNPTTGTLISDANVARAFPANLASAAVFDGLSYSASGDGKTVTDGDAFSQFTIHLPGHTIQEYNGSLILPAGSAMAISVKPSYATEACIEIQGWLEDVN